MHTKAIERREREIEERRDIMCVERRAKLLILFATSSVAYCMERAHTMAIEKREREENKRRAKLLIL